ncbi:MAG: hypothetical protein U1E89_02400 [Burkholderiaceae bacterium]
MTSGPIVLRNRAGLVAELNGNGSLRRMLHGALMVNLFPGNEAEGGPAALVLRVHGAAGEASSVPLLGPASPLATRPGGGFERHGLVHGLHVQLRLVLADDAPVWAWQLRVHNRGARAQRFDLLHLQDVGLAAPAAIRLNEAYVSHYVDIAPLAHPRAGWLLAARQNQPVAQRHPWLIVGSLRRAVSFATDAVQVAGHAARHGAPWPGLRDGLPARRLQHEHAMLALQDEPLTLEPGERAQLGFVARLVADHPAASGAGDIAAFDSARAELPPWPDAALEAEASAAPAAPVADAASLFVRAPWLDAQALGEAELARWFGPERRHAEHDAQGRLLSFFHGAAAHVVLRDKELAVQRAHGHILRGGAHLVPDEGSLTSTAWMAGAFHSMLTQGHVSINRMLSTVRSGLGLYRSQGQRVFVHLDGAWRQLGVPSAFEMRPEACRWIYRHARGTLEVRSEAGAARHEMLLGLRVIDGPPLRLCVSHHVALGGDDGEAAVALAWHRDGDAVCVPVPPQGELAARFPGGALRIEPLPGTVFAAVGGDEMLYADGHGRGSPFVCIDTAEPVERFELRLLGRLFDAARPPATTLGALRLRAPPAAAGASAVAQLDEILPWFRHDALVHYLSPRGLEQYSGGGWGTRDVCQGPLEMLLALDQPAPARDLLARVFAAQDAGGDWPQWFMFFARERELRAGDAHGDIVFWPLLALGQYLLASGDAGLLDEPLPFHAPAGQVAEVAPLWGHVQRALAVIERRLIAGTALVAYGHGDWNDSLQPADPALREHLCSAWTVTLHEQTLRTLALALHELGRAGDAAALQTHSDAVRTAFGQLVVDGVVTGYMLRPPGQMPQWLLHPRDERTGVRYSLLPMVHAILGELLTPQEAQAHLALIRGHLLGADGARLFDRPLPYRGGPMQLFQRAESSAFFGREIGLMYMHAHLRYAQALAHVGDAEAFFDALMRAQPIALAGRVPSSSLRQANCYYSSSDAAFADRDEAARGYDRVRNGTVAFDGGWRIYSSGPGIAVALVVHALLGIRRGWRSWQIDPVVPPSLDGLHAELPLGRRTLVLCIHVGARGCGVRALRLDGQPLAFRRAAHRYRTGAAEVDAAAFAERPGGAASLRLDIEID